MSIKRQQQIIEIIWRIESHVSKISSKSKKKKKCSPTIILLRLFNKKCQEKCSFKCDFFLFFKNKIFYVKVKFFDNSFFTFHCDFCSAPTHYTHKIFVCKRFCRIYSHVLYNKQMFILIADQQPIAMGMRIVHSTVRSRNSEIDIIQRSKRIYENDHCLRHVRAT